MSLKESFINLWKVAGEFDNPKNMTVGLKKFLGRDEVGLPLVSFFDPDVVISGSDIKFGEDGGIFDHVNEIRYEG